MFAHISALIWKTLHSTFSLKFLHLYSTPRSLYLLHTCTPADLMYLCLFTPSSLRSFVLILLNAEALPLLTPLAEAIFNSFLTSSASLFVCFGSIWLSYLFVTSLSSLYVDLRVTSLWNYDDSENLKVT